MLGFPVGILVSNAVEWYAHQRWLHEYPSKHRESPFFGHIKHHKRVRQNGFYDETYHQPMLAHSDIYMEKTSLIGLCALTTLAAPVAPFFTLGTYYGAWHYYASHKKSHLNPEWGRRHLPWHYDHHMGRNTNANWCVTRPWFDYLMGTRVIEDQQNAETNPLGMKLPRAVERSMNWIGSRTLPNWPLSNHIEQPSLKAV